MKNIRSFFLVIACLAALGLLLLALSGCGSSSAPLPVSEVATPAPSVSPTASPKPNFLGACLKENANFKTANGGCQDKTFVVSKLNLELKDQLQSIADCEALTESGFTDWRLPYENEYQILWNDGFVQVENFYSLTPSVLWVWTANIMNMTGDRLLIGDGSTSGVLSTQILPHFCIRDATAL